MSHYIIKGKSQDDEDRDLWIWHDFEENGGYFYFQSERERATAFESAEQCRELLKKYPRDGHSPKIVRVRTAADLREERLALRADKKVAIKALCDIRIELIYLGLGASKAFDMATTALRKLDPAVMPQEKREIVLRSSGGGASVARQARLATKR